MNLKKALDTLEDQILQKTRRKSSDAPKYMEKSVATDTKCNCYVSVKRSEQLSFGENFKSLLFRDLSGCNLVERIWKIRI